MVKIMRKFFYILLFSVLSISPLKEAKFSFWARSYIVMEQNSGQILEGNQLQLERSVASISKVMTAVLAVESDDFFRIVTIGEEISTAMGSCIYIQKGDRISICDLTYGLMLRSGNDAALAIAHHLGGSIDHFVEMMNEKALQIGMKHTTFHNPHGLDLEDEGNISTVYDMALLFRYAMSLEPFRTITSTKKYHSSLKGLWTNKHKLIQNYPYANGGKTGYTSKAKRTLMTYFCKDELELLVITFDCGGDFSYHKELFEKYDAQYTYVTFLKKGHNQIANYIFSSPYKVGLLAKKEEMEGGKKLYYICEETQRLTMFFITKNGERIKVQEVYLNSYAK